jgi:hypothetical protein
MSPFTSEESVTSEYVKNENPDAIINIVDATNLSRSLFFTTQLLELGIPVVVALNKSDINEKKKTEIDEILLSQKLGCPVIETVSTEFFEDLKGYEDFDEADKEKVHIASGEDENNFIITDFTSDEFKTNYPISKNAFDAENRQKGFTLGDVNIDGTVDSTDASLILNSYANLTIYGFSRINAAQELAADVNCDDSIDSVDASVVLAYYGYVSTGGNDSLENFIKKVK